MHKIWFNGVGYPDPDAMPPEVRRQYEDALRRKQEADREDHLEIVRMGSWEDDGDRTLEIHTSREIVINGKKYSDLDDLPPSDRELVRRLMSGFPDLDEVFQKDGLLDMFGSLAGGSHLPREGAEDPEVGVRSSRVTQSLDRFPSTRRRPPWASGWAVALVLAVALLWVLVFG